MTQLSNETLAALTDVYEALPGMRAAEDRQRYLPIVAQDLGINLYVSQTGERRSDVERMLRACSAHWGGVWALLEALGLFFGADLTRTREQVSRHLTEPVLEASERADLIRLLAHAPLDQPWLRQAHRFAAPWAASPLRTPRSALDVAQELEDLSAESDGPPCLLTFVAAVVQKTGHRGLATWYDDVASRRGIEADEREDLLRLADTHLGGHASTDGLGRQPAVFEAVPPRNVHFTGRRQLLNELRDRLAGGATALVPCALHGHGGIGKTQVAVEYCYRFQTDYELVWWVSAEQETQIRASLAELAARLRLADGGDQSQRIGAALDALRRGEPYRRWLLVFDNAGSPSELREYFRYSTGHVLVTSRDRAWAATDSANAMDVDVLSRDDSVHLVRRRVRMISAADANRLADRVGDLPIALEQAASYQLVFGVSVGEYLRLLDDDPSGVLADGAAPGYGSSVEATFRLARERLRGRSPAAAQLLELAAFFGPEPISRRILLAARNVGLPDPLGALIQDDLRLIQTIREIAQLSLVRLDPRRGTIQLHRLLRDLVQASLTPNQRLENRGWASEALSNVNPGDPDTAHHWPVYAEMAPHVAAVGCGAADTARIRKILLDQVRYLYATGDYVGSWKLAEPTFKDWQHRLGPDAEETLILARHLGNALRALGRYRESRKIVEETWDRARATAGPTNLHTMITAYSLGAELRIEGKFQRAYDLDRENAQRLGEVLGAHLHTFRAANNLSVDLRLLGRHSDAETKDRETIASCQQVFGHDHQQTLYTSLNLASDLYGLGYFADAIAEFERAIPILEQTVGAHHAYAVRATRQYALALREIGRIEHADLHLHRVLRLYEELHTDDRHIDVIAATASLANLLLALDEVHAARGRAEQAVVSYSSVLGARHPFTLAASTNLAIILRAAESHAAAAKVTDESYLGLCGVLGYRHPYTLAARAGQAVDHSIAGRAVEAAAQAENVYLGYVELFGAQHPTTLEAAFNLGLYRTALEPSESTEMMMAHSMEGLRRIVGDGHTNLRRAVEGLPIELDVEPPPI